MIVGNLNGGLGNQMFQYSCARALSLELDLPLKFTIDVLNAYNSHNEFEFEQVFSLKLDNPDKMELAELIGWWRIAPAVRRVLGKFPLSSLAGKNFIGEPNFKYWLVLSERARQGGYLQGNWQSERDVIANSSFRWWGAWLNHRQDKMVIAPKRWFTNGLDTQDLIPKEWERM